MKKIKKNKVINMGNNIYSFFNLPEDVIIITVIERKVKFPGRKHYNYYYSAYKKYIEEGEHYVLTPNHSINFSIFEELDNYYDCRGMTIQTIEVEINSNPAVIYSSERNPYDHTEHKFISYNFEDIIKIGSEEDLIE